MAKVYLVGAGPGDPELLTLKAARLLERADVILYDRLVNPAILAMAKPGAELVYVGKEEGCAAETQRRIFSALALNALRGKCVVRLKGGDPMVFGRGAEEWARPGLLRAGPGGRARTPGEGGDPFPRKNGGYLRVLRSPAPATGSRMCGRFARSTTRSGTSPRRSRPAAYWCSTI